MIAAAAFALLPVSAASASTGTVGGDERAAAVQAVLDRVLGAGNAVVAVSDTIQTSTSAVADVQYGSGVAGVVGSTRTVVAGAASSREVVQQNLLSGATTSTVTPPGALVRQSVAVAVDKAHLGRTGLATIRRLVAAAVGLTPSRGDRLSVVSATFAQPAATPVVAAAPFAWLMPYVAPTIWTFGGVVALGILAAMFGGRRRGAAARG